MAQTPSSSSTPTNITITVRVIKSFEYRNFKNIILHNVDLNQTLRQLQHTVDDHIAETIAFKPFRNGNFDTFKIYTKAFGAKTSNLIINLDHEDYLLELDKTLKESGIEHETEISYFNREAFETFKLHPDVKW